MNIFAKLLHFKLLNTPGGEIRIREKNEKQAKQLFEEIKNEIVHNPTAKEKSCQKNHRKSA